MGSEGLVWPVVAAAFAVAWWLTRTCCRPDSRLHFLDHPNERSLHVRPIPRTGGVGVMGGVGAAAVSLVGFGQMTPGMLAALGGAGVLAVLGLLDDRRSLSARLRLAVQCALAAGFLFAAGLGEGLPLAAVLLLMLVWMSNLYNFMDGSDGLAGGMAVIGFVVYALAAAQAGERDLAALCAGVAAAAAGFLCFNFHPARIFMGDVGSVPLGFLAGALGMVGWRAGAWPAFFPLLVFSVFIVDASVTLVQRALRGEKVWQAHRSHYYQRMVRMGLGHRGTALRAYGLMAATGLSALVILPTGFSLRCVIITMWVSAFLVVGFRIDRAWRRYDTAEATKP